MNISYTLIVALMYVTILSFGLANLLSSLAGVLKKGNGIQVSVVHVNWILILLVVHFNLTWHAVLLANVEEWSYFSFIIIVLGPILAFFTTTIVAPTSHKDLSIDNLIKNYFQVKNQLLSLFIAVNLWSVISDYVLGRGLTGSALFNFVLVIISLVLFKNQNHSFHRNGILLIWILYIGSIFLRDYQLIQ